MTNEPISGARRGQQPERDPAIEAAQRAMRNWPGRRVNQDELATAAREALKPIRELHKPITEPIWWHADEPGEYTRCSCQGLFGRWPCETAKLIYSSEEVDRG